MTVGRPCVEREQGSKNTETDEDEGEENLLDIDGNVVFLGYLEHVHRVTATEVEDAKQSEDKQCGASHEHQGELHGRVFLVAAAPNADEKIHRDKSDLVEHEHREHINGDEEAVDTRGKQGEPKEIFLCHGLELP